ncbi:MAG: Lon-like protease [Nocardioidaceae bacterium]|jgi:PDZ domain-containing protein|nr:Lon-like protease [Nocardioidaceae bacterium]
MRRRSTALAVAAICLAALFAVAFFAPVPYVIMSPGITENTLGTFGGKPVITVNGHQTYPTTGHLNLTTVSVTSADYDVRLPQVLDAWLSSTQIVLPRDVIYPPNQTVQQVEHTNTQEMTDSQSAAVVAGLGEAGIAATDVKVQKVEPDTPAAGVLHVGDVIGSVDAKPTKTLAELYAAIRAVPPRSPVTLRLLRSGTARTVTITTRPNPKDPSQSQVGFIPELGYDPPFKVDISLGQDIGGPSAGLMFSLAIYDKITPGSLTGGRFIAGTGTIDATGQVGEIGGIQQKIAGAYDDGARYFLVPAGNCTEAASSSLAGKVELIKVSTLDQAVQALKALDAGNASAFTRCGS